MGSPRILLYSSAVFIALFVVTHTINTCYLLESRPGRCIFVINGFYNDTCRYYFGGTEYVPTSVQDYKELRKIFYWRNINHKQFTTGLRYRKENHDLVFEQSDDNNFWEVYSGATKVDPIAINFDKTDALNNSRVIMVFDGDKFWSHASTDQFSSPLLCEASIRIESFCPKDFHMFRPGKRCFKAVTDAHTTPIAAEKRCREINSVLASINNVEEDMYMRRKSQNFLHLGTRSAWKKIEHDYPDKSTRPRKGEPGDPKFMEFFKKYFYNLDGYPVSYENFDKGQPDYNTANENYIMREKGYLWHDVPASFVQGYLCSTLPDHSYRKFYQN